MSQQQLEWQVQPNIQPPEVFIEEVKHYASGLPGHYAAQLLWQRGIRDTTQLAGYLNPNLYQPASPFEFGQEMRWAIERLLEARNSGEKVAIWGDFDADGITSTSILWDGLGQFFAQYLQLSYYIPNRLTESHGLNDNGIKALAESGTKLIVTCDTGSTNISEIEYAQKLGVDIIVTDHHTLPTERPDVKAIINPRYLPPEHPMFHLSGVAVAYKLVEALYETLPDVPQQPLEDLLDLVAIGLIADLVQLSGDCRYLAQRGIERLQQQLKKRNRPGVARLLELCQKSGDRPTDISFGLGPRINAVSRIQGDASFCVELLTSRDEKRTQQLATETELANCRRKALQKDVALDVNKKLAQLDLSTTSVIVLCDPQWAVGVLGLVAGQVAQETGRPTVLLSTEGDLSENAIARGSARSVNQVDLYQLVNAQAHLLHRFGGHPFAAGLSLPVQKIPLFTEAINQQLRATVGTPDGTPLPPIVQADLVCTVRELGKDLFRELKLLEPCGMGNPVPKLLIQNCWFESMWNSNTQDFKGRKVQYIKTKFKICDDSCQTGFEGIWWGHYKEDLPKGRCDAIVELDFNSYENSTKGIKPHYEVRMIAVRSLAQTHSLSTTSQLDWILDCREESLVCSTDASPVSLHSSVLPVRECPSSWDELQVWFRRAQQTNRKLAIAYHPPEPIPPDQIWLQLVGIAKYLSRTGETASDDQISQKLGISDRTLQLGLDALSHLGFFVKQLDWNFQISFHPEESSPSLAKNAIEQFIGAVQEEQFRQKYFYQVPLSAIRAMATQNAIS
ncbi:single-stranded-DNA-specific exonuclease RecJ [Funiculus sociatus GB2-A5]|uniref:Single-stranded-DNA-specific exonuclease RecJ n=1 Tax=Funiculus sociatus GB2-A5 TaxID=2933946 RepID=A0ABV0JRN0_9CYAN|nr:MULTISPECIES: single-stranded-DNA-specific exonuclease RecJ [unclassified Trichocoleus]MBD1905037.1 single-stranded-DNA-specific exonuclease RecJ [Trichocoleus sp. FACHB-832]MBD2064107.1 single-stranded-DNA-specific exonuclease RecJ [Trichocoleus sp. FACHB-6]